MTRIKFKDFEKLMDELYKFSREVKSYDSSARHYGTEDKLYMTEVHTLRIIGRNPAITISEITETTSRTKSAVSQIIDKLCSKAIVVKEKDPNDNRRYILRMTEKGQIIFDYHEVLDKDNYNKYITRLDDISNSDIETTRNVITQLLKNAR